MRIAFIGQKGIPATWGGVEFHVNELARRLRNRGHDVTVYVRNWYTPKQIKEHLGIKLIHTPCINTKHLDAASHSLTSSIHTLFNSYNIVHYHAMGPALFSWIPRIFCKKVVATIHRFDYEAKKWGNFAKKALKVSERIAFNIPQKTIVVAKHQEDFYKSKGYRPIYIPNGVNIPKKAPSNIIKEKYSLHGKDYILFLGRLVPEKQIDWVIKAFKMLKTVRIQDKNLKLVIAGGSSATDKYVKQLYKIADRDSDIIFTGFAKGRLKKELLSNALLFVVPSALEGLPIALLEAMSYELPCLVSNILPHQEIITDGVNGFFFNHNEFSDFVQKMGWLLGRSEILREIGSKAREKVQKEYNWDKVVNKVEQIYNLVFFSG